MKTQHIPKTIHYCWFSGKKKPAFLEKCIASWHTYCPDYEIKAWTAENFDLQMNVYVAHYAKKKQWAFVSDFARFYILYHEGGIYLDSDVEVLKSFDDLLQYEGFLPFLYTRTPKVSIAQLGAEVIGAQKGHPIMREAYEQELSDFENGTKKIVNFTLDEVFIRNGLKKHAKQNIQGIEILIPPSIGSILNYNGLHDPPLYPMEEIVREKPEHVNFNDWLKQSNGKYFPKEMYAFHWSEMTWVHNAKPTTFIQKLKLLKQNLRKSLKTALPFLFRIHVFLRRKVPLYYKVYIWLFPHDDLTKPVKEDHVDYF